MIIEPHQQEKISALGEIIFRFGPVFENHVIEMVAQYAKDEEFHYETSVLLSAQYETTRHNINHILENLPSSHSESFFYKILPLISPYIEHNPQLIDDCIVLMASEIVHHQKWDDVLEKFPQTEEYLKLGIG